MQYNEWRPRDKAQIKFLEPRGIIGRFLQVNLWEGNTCVLSLCQMARFPDNFNPQGLNKQSEMLPVQ
eukprot:6281244-Amphidinium_carterae.2